MQNNKSKLQEIREAIVSEIRELILKHINDIFDVSDCGGAPVIWPSADDQDFDTYTLDGIHLDKDEVLVDSSSSDNSRTDSAEALPTDVLVEILDFLEQDEELIWRPDEEAGEEFIMKRYHANGVCMGDLLGDIVVDELPYGRDMTVEQVFELYIRCKHRADGDEFFRENDACGEKGERKNLLTEESEPLKKPVFVLQNIVNNDGVNDSSVINAYTDKAEAEAELKVRRDKFVEGLEGDEALESIDLLVDGLTDETDCFSYYKFDTNHLFELKVVKMEI